MTDNNNYVDAAVRYVDENKLDIQCALTRQQAIFITRKAMLANSMMFILADVVNTFLMDCEYNFDKLGSGLSQKTKMNFNNMMRHIRAARSWSEKLTKPMYENKEADDLCIDSDWWTAFIKLVDDRIGTDQRKTHLLLEFLLNMPKGDSVYNVTYNDFCHDTKGDR